MSTSAVDGDLISAWFEQLSRDCSIPLPGGDPVWVGNNTLGQRLIEVLSDCANELFCSALFAAHLRRFGREFFHTRCLAGERFWVRSEWTKVDISYGLASERFGDWDEAWCSGTTGDLGCLELKLMYGHYTADRWASKVHELADQLRTRRERVSRWHSELRFDPSRSAALAYHGLLLFVGPRDARPTTHALKEWQVQPLTEWKQLGEMDGASLLELWPRSRLPGWELHACLLDKK